LKKGALYILGHVILTEDFAAALPEARRQQTAWTKYIDFSRIKGFVNIAISPHMEWGARNIVLNAGLGGMRPNIAVLGSYNLKDYHRTQPLIDVTPVQSPDGNGGSGKSPTRSPSKDHAEGELPTDDCRTEPLMKPTTYVTLLEDLVLRIQINVAVAKGFQMLELPHEKQDQEKKKYIDLWPIQMSAEINDPTKPNESNVMTTNFDTYTLILQLGCILHTVPSWKKHYAVRVVVFVEYESDVLEERERVTSLLTNLRIQAEVLVLHLASGTLRTYEVIVNGADVSTLPADVEADADIERVLGDEDWWTEVKKWRGHGRMSPSEELGAVESLVTGSTNWPSAVFHQGPVDTAVGRFAGIKKMLTKRKRRHTMSGLNRLGVSLTMRTHRLHPDLVDRHVTHGSDSEDSGSSSSSDSASVFASDDEWSNGSIASDGDLLHLEDDDITPLRPESSGSIRRKSLSGPIVSQSSRKGSLRQAALQASKSSLIDPNSQNKADSSVTLPDATLFASKPSSIASQSSQSSQKKPRPPMGRHDSMPKFSSRPVPKTEVAEDETTGPSIMFSDRPSPTRGNTKTGERPASGFPSASSLPLSFNDLPCRAQHLILNNLMRLHSTDTAVVMTTLPSPLEGTCKDEEESLRYLTDLDILTEGLPPALLVHSNSMTVTMNL
jgi:solute carrier family 12 (potassium/chloride transporters), member 9